MGNVLETAVQWAPSNRLEPELEGETDAAATPVIPEPEVPNDAPAWSRFSGSCRLQEWALELQHACRASDLDADPWELAGRAALIIGDDEASCAAVLRRVAADAGMSFVSIADDDVIDIAQPSVFPQVFQQYAPVLVYLQPGRWMKDKSEKEDGDLVASMQRFQSSFATSLRAFDRKHPVVIVTSSDEIAGLAASLRHVGLFDRFLALQTPTMDALGDAFIERIGRACCAATITEHPGKVGVLVSQEYQSERRRGLVVLRLRRLVAREQRSLEFLDLVNVALHGFAEADALPAAAEEMRRMTAWHEAGHAAVSVIDSNGRNVPEYLSIVPHAGCDGVVVDSYKYLLDSGDRMTYADMRHKVRIGLAGRAAEELAFGPERVSNGSRDDLKKATVSAGRAFAFWGFAPSMEREGQSGSNLSLIGIDDDPITASEAVHLEALVREFLATEYRVVMEMLAAHRPLLDAIAERLMVDAFVDQAALAELVQGAHRPTS